MYVQETGFVAKLMHEAAVGRTDAETLPNNIGVSLIGFAIIVSLF